jgi:hypothetical protein
VTDDLVKRLNMVDATMNPMTLVIVAREAADRIEQQERYLAEAQKCLDAGDYEGALIICRAALGEKNK